jgi:hypothetical protein
VYVSELKMQPSTGTVLLWDRYSSTKIPGAVYGLLMLEVVPLNLRARNGTEPTSRKHATSSFHADITCSLCGRSLDHNFCS